MLSYHLVALPAGNTTASATHARAKQVPALTWLPSPASHSVGTRIPGLGRELAQKEPGEKLAERLADPRVRGWGTRPRGCSRAPPRQGHPEKPRCARLPSGFLLPSCPSLPGSTLMSFSIAPSQSRKAELSPRKGCVFPKQRRPGVSMTSDHNVAIVSGNAPQRPVDRKS